jgi:DNA polymerase
MNSITSEGLVQHSEAIAEHAEAIHIDAPTDTEFGPQHILYRDYETRSVLNLKEFGAWKYATDPSTDVWCCAYRIDKGPVFVWFPGDPVPPEFTEASNNPNYVVSAFNDGFERLIEQHIMGPRYGWPLIPIERHRCTQAAALSLALPASLQGVAKALGLEQQKDEAGARLMLQMSKPRKPREGESKGIYWHDDAERLERLAAYCKQDVLIESAIQARIGHLSDAEQRLWVLDAKINDRGMSADRKLLEAAIGIGNAARMAIDAELCAATGGAVQSVNQVEKLAGWLVANGCSINDTRKPTLETLLKRSDISSAIRRVIKLRLGGRQAASLKYETMLRWLGVDDRIRGAFKFHGAATGRWTSLGVQVQNFKRPTIDLAPAIQAVLTGEYDHVRNLYEHPLSVVADIARAVICAAPGHRLIAADFSGVESRLAAWLAGEQWKIDAWEKFDQTQNPEDEPYYILGRKFGFHPGVAREPGKLADLAFGYGGGLGAWRKLASKGDTSTEAEIEQHKSAWREAHPGVVSFWHELQRKASFAITNPGVTFRVNKRVCFEHRGDFLYMGLPSRRELAYPFPRLETDVKGQSVVFFKDNAAGKFVDCNKGKGAWHGMWIENAVQAVARDLFAAAMLRLEDAAYPIVTHVHDEICAEVPDGFGSPEEFLRVLTASPDWTEGLPVSAKVREGLRFAKLEPSQEQPTHQTEPADDDPPPQSDELAEDDDDADDDEDDITDDGDGADYDYDDPNNNAGDDGYSSGESERGRVVAQYEYPDQHGNPYHLIKRMTPKSFPQYHWEDGRWLKGAPDGPRVPYRLPQLLAAPNNKNVCICEGEKDADRLAALGLVATCNPGGAGKWNDDLNRWFALKEKVFVFEDNDDPGRDHIIKVASSLKNALPKLDVKIVRLPNLPPKGDVSDWLDAGRTKEDLISQLQAAEPFEEDDELGEVDAGSDVELPPPRKWLLGNSFCRKFASSLIAQGAVGKTALRYAQLLSVATGRQLTGEHVFVRCRVLIISLEDDTDELRRRIWAVRKRYGISNEDLRGWLFYAAPGIKGGKLMTIDDTGRRRVRGKLAAKIERAITRHNIDIVSIDPFVKSHGCEENSNDAMAEVTQVLIDLAHKYDISIDSPHHTAKGPSAAPGERGRGRGASSFEDALRLAYDLDKMTSDEAEGFGIPEAERKLYIRMEKAKVNIAPPSANTKWFKLVGVSLDNSDDIYKSGDNVQTVEVWTPPEVWDGLSNDVIDRILNEIDGGMPDGNRYSAASSARDRAAWRVVVKHVADKTESQAREIIKTWVTNGVLVERDDYENPKTRKKNVTGVAVNPEKRPTKSAP